MKLTNVSQRLIFVGTTMLMPDNSIDANESVVNTPGVQALIGTGMLSVDDPAAKTAAAKDAEAQLRAEIEAKVRAEIEAEMREKAVNNEPAFTAEKAEQPKTAKTTAAKTAKSAKSGK